MKTFYEDWPETFVSRLDMLRALDDRGSTRRLYLERTGAIFDALAEEIRTVVAGHPEIDVSELDIGPLYRYYKRGEKGIRWLTYLLSWLHQLVNGFVYLLKCT
ncbi:hypothetical protein ACVV4J_26550 [Escherichia coli]